MIYIYIYTSLRVQTDITKLCLKSLIIHVVVREIICKNTYNLYMRSDLTYVNYFECVLCMSLASVQDCVTNNKNNKS